MKTWKLNDKTLEFDERSHCYIMDGLIVPSVTQILGNKFNDYVGVDEKILKKAAENGTKMHLDIELYEKEGREVDTKELRNYKFLKKHYNIENLENEIPIYFEKDGKVLYAGTIDQVCMRDGKLAINDFKRVSAPNKEKIAYQLNLYRLGYECTYHKKVELLSFMQLRENTRKFVNIPIKEDMTLDLIEEYLGIINEDNKLQNTR